MDTGTELDLAPPRFLSLLKARDFRGLGRSVPLRASLRAKPQKAGLCVSLRQSQQEAT
jgi:hypothetical protein